MKIVLIVLLLVRGEFALSRAEAKTAYRDARVELRQVGVDLKLVSQIRVRRDPSTAYSGDIYGAIVRRRFWQNYIQSHYKKNVYAIKHVMLPPVQYEGSIWYYGAASQCSYGDKYPVTIVAGHGYSRLSKQLNAVTSAHEIAHSLGASHDNSNGNIMNADALSFVGDNGLDFNQRAIIEIRTCQGWQ